MTADLQAVLKAVPVSQSNRLLRALMPVLDERIRAGVSHADLITALAQQGISISPAALEKRLYRWRRAQGKTQSPTAAPPLIKSALPSPQPITSKADLVALRNTNIDLEELARLGKETNQESS